MTDAAEYRVPRYFAVSPAGEAWSMTYHESLAHMGVSPAVSAGYDVLVDAGMPADRAAPLVLAAERNGQDPEAFARHVVRLRRALRNPT